MDQHFDELRRDYPDLLAPERLWSRAEVLTSPSPVPKSPGVYAWYFNRVPQRVPTADCLTVGGLTLLYVGISPKAPPTNGAQASRQTLRSRLQYHMRGNAEGSTLRLTLGCLLSEQLGLGLCRVGSGTRLTFCEGERRLSEWLAENAFVTWMTCPEPWVIEEELIRHVALPLNLDQNDGHLFHPVLTAIRKTARAAARQSAIWHPPSGPMRR